MDAFTYLELCTFLTLQLIKVLRHIGGLQLFLEISRTAGCEPQPRSIQWNTLKFIKFLLCSEYLCSPKFKYQNLYSQGDGSRRQDIWEGIRSWKLSFMDGMSAVTEETPENSPMPSTMWGHGEKTAIWTQRQAPRRRQLYQCLHLGLPASRTVRNTLGCLWATQSMIFGYSISNRLWHFFRATKIE